MERNTWYVSDEWLRTYVYQRGKEGDAETWSGLLSQVHLAEARATLHDGRLSHTDMSLSKEPA